MRSLLPFLCALLASCATESTSESTSPPATTAAPPPRSVDEPRSPADPPSAANGEDPPCPKAPCAARPVVFVHGFTGSNDDWAPLAMSLVSGGDPRWDAVRFVGTGDHADWAARSIGRRGSLFVFDYYVLHGNDGRRTYTAGHGRIGSHGRIAPDNDVYDTSVDHDYAADLATLVDDVIRATGIPKVDIVAHSMGGLVARSYLAFYGGNAKVEKVLLVASPTLGISLIDFAALFPDAFPPWMGALEMAELDGGGPFAKVRFHLADRGGDAAGPWPSKLLEAEDTLPEVHVMSGERDPIVSYESAHHPKAKTHVVADADHAGLLQAPETRARVVDLCGGVFRAAP